MILDDDIYKVAYGLYLHSDEPDKFKPYLTYHQFILNEKILNRYVDAAKKFIRLRKLKKIFKK